MSGENVAGEIFEDFLDEYWIYIPYNFRQSERVNELQIKLNNSFGKNMENGGKKQFVVYGIDIGVVNNVIGEQ